jgi:hypothetical protein
VRVIHERDIVPDRSWKRTPFGRVYIPL